MYSENHAIAHLLYRTRGSGEALVTFVAKVKIEGAFDTLREEGILCARCQTRGSQIKSHPFTALPIGIFIKKFIKLDFFKSSFLLPT